MATYGVNLKIDVSKIKKEHLFKGEKGAYLDLTAFINVDEQGQYGDNGMVTQNWKDQQKGEGPILGNAKVFWRDDGHQAQQAPKQQSAPTGKMPEPIDDFDDDK
jgi:hypothetical protein